MIDEELQPLEEALKKLEAPKQPKGNGERTNGKPYANKDDVTEVMAAVVRQNPGIAIEDLAELTKHKLAAEGILRSLLLLMLVLGPISGWFCPSVIAYVRARFANEESRTVNQSLEQRRNAYQNSRRQTIPSAEEQARMARIEAHRQVRLEQRLLRSKREADSRVQDWRFP